MPLDLQEGPWQGRLDDPIAAWRLARLFDLLGRERRFRLVLYPATDTLLPPPILRGTVHSIDLPYDSERGFWELSLKVIDQDQTARTVRVASESFVVSPQEDGSYHVVFRRSAAELASPTLVLLAPPPTDSHGHSGPPDVP